MSHNNIITISSKTPIVSVVQAGETSSPYYSSNFLVLSLALYPTGSGRYEWSITDVDTIAHDIENNTYGTPSERAYWHPWSSGDIAVDTHLVQSQPTVAIRAVSVAGTLVYEILGDIRATGGGGTGGIGGGGPGTPGAAGTSIFSGLGPPNAILGNDGDKYIQEDNGDLWSKTLGVWAISSNLTSTGTLEDQYNTNLSVNAMLAGQPVYITAVGSLELAQADSLPRFRVAGFLIADVGAASASSFRSDGQLILADWTSVVGTPTLVIGAEYFLSATTPGQITTVIPTAIGEYIVPIGRAINSTTLDIELTRPILL